MRNAFLAAAVFSFCLIAGTAFAGQLFPPWNAPKNASGDYIPCPVGQVLTWSYDAAGDLAVGCSPIIPRCDKGQVLTNRDGDDIPECIPVVANATVVTSTNVCYAASCTAYCPGGYKATGGGYSTYYGENIDFNGPVGDNGWSIDDSAYKGGYAVTVYFKCVLSN